MTTDVRVLPTAEPPVLEPVSPERVTPLRPSEALRLGRLLYPVQVFGSLGDGPNGKARCAIGAIWAVSDELAFFGDNTDCPVSSRDRLGRNRRCRRSADNAGSIVIHLNDQHHWSDDQIVAWLQSLGL